MNLNEVIISAFNAELKQGIKDAPKGKRFLCVIACSGHMSIYCEYYDTLKEIETAKGKELLDPMWDSHIKLIWDLEHNDLLFYDAIGMTYSAFDWWKKA